MIKLKIPDLWLERRRKAPLLLALLALSLTAWPISNALAAGPIWLPVEQATHSTFDNIHPVMATYRNYAFILTTRDQGAEPFEQVYFTTNVAGSWTTRLLSVDGPGSSYGAQWTALAIDPSSYRLYAAWVHPSSRAMGPDSLWLMTSTDGGATWSAPVTLASGQQLGPPAIAAAHGKAYVTYTAAPDAKTEPCHDTTSRTSDIMLVASTGGTWSAPQNLSSCLPAAATLSFDGPKLALDEATGAAYLISDSEEDNLWYMDNASGTWSVPQSIVSSMEDLGQEFGGYRYDYRIAVSAGTVYIAYGDRTPGHAATPYGYHDIFLIVHPHGGPWTRQQVTHDPNNCVKAQLALVARAGRLGLAYITFGGAACAGATGPSYSLPHVLTGTPDHWNASSVEIPAKNSCTSPVLSTDGDLFRLALVCGGPGGNADPHGDLFYMPEFEDVVGPTVTTFTAPATATAPAVMLRWSAQDPTPGAGVAYFELQVSDNGGPEQTVVAATRSEYLIYTHLTSGHTYLFRLRARDKVNNWGPWRSLTVRAA